MAVTTRFAYPAVITDRCADYEQTTGVHITVTYPTGGERRVIAVIAARELRADGGWAEIDAAARSAPVLDCRHHGAT